MSDAVNAQAHTRFKVFSGAAKTAAEIDAVFAQVESFAADRSVAAKSIGVEYVEAAGKLVVTLGYREDEAGYGVKLTRRSLGTVDSMDDLSGLEGRMAEAAAELGEGICHELFITAEREFVMVFMAAA